MPEPLLHPVTQWINGITRDSPIDYGLTELMEGACRAHREGRTVTYPLEEPPAGQGPGTPSPRAAARRQAVKKATTVQQTAARRAAIEAWGIWVLTWSMRSHPVHIELSTVVSEMGEHWSP